MIRKLSLAVAVATALSPLGALALGLGEIHTQSALNQSFKADIDLLSTSKDDLQDVKVALASPDAFAKAGLERPFLLNELKFTPSLTPDGRVVIAVTSREPIREPFLDFIIEVNWPKGRLMREYTVLLDPPVTLERRPAAVQAPRVSAAPLSAAPPVATRPAPARVTYSASTSSGAREYGPIRANDNLWKIAKQLQEAGESTEQVMMALQRYNPDAFIRNNVNGLKVGKILRLPADADVTAISRREARQEFLAQTREWRAGRGQAAASSTPTTAAAESAGAGAQAAAAKEEDRLKLVSAKPEEGGEAAQAKGPEGTAEKGPEISRLEQELLLVQEANESARQENQTLRDRVSELEAQISDIKRLLTLKNDQLTKLQTNQQIAAGKTEVQQPTPLPAPAETPMETAPAEKPAAEVSPEGAQAPAETPPEQATGEAAGPAETGAPEAVESPQPEAVTPAEQAQAEVPPVQQEPQVQPAPAPAPQPKPPAAPAKAPQGESFLETLTANPTMLAIVGGAAVLLLILLALIMRRRKEAEAEFAESILVTPESGAAAAAVSGSGAINEPTDETSFMSDFSPSDIDALQDETGEVDPISEADVYIAYGRYQQAEELIRQAISRFPDRDDLKLKLLEIHYSAKNSDQFTKLAEELKQEGLEEKDPDAWAKVAAMGKEINPGSTLFAGAAAATGAALGSAGDDLEDLGLDLESSLDDTRIPGSQETGESTSETIDSMDLSGLDNLDQMDSENLEAELSLDSEFLNSLDSSQQADSEGAESLDSDLPGASAAAGSDAETKDDALGLASSLDESSSLSELELGTLGQDSQAADSEGVIGIEDSESLDDLDLESLEKELESLSGDLDAQSELDVGDESTPAPAAESEDQGLDLDSTDEVTTKLDLARAYVDMGDQEGARGILEEVVSEGSEQQKQQAQELLAGMSD